MVQVETRILEINSKDSPVRFITPALVVSQVDNINTGLVVVSIWLWRHSFDLMIHYAKIR